VSRRALCSWSGGKDSCLALHVALEDGLEVDTLLTVFDDTDDRSRSHALPAALIAAQADALGMRLLLVRADWNHYEAVFIAALANARCAGIHHAVFGDIDLLAYRQWEERVCAIAHVNPHLPLWLKPRNSVVEAVLGQGIEALCVCVNTRFLPKEFCGRPYDAQFIRDLPEHVDACGENGEFHTFVTNAPRFRQPISVRHAPLRSYTAPAAYGSDEFWFADLSLAPPRQ
jgi:uncharacterized protein (TIGR00290 family)